MGFLIFSVIYFPIKKTNSVLPLLVPGQWDFLPSSKSFFIIYLNKKLFKCRVLNIYFVFFIIIYYPHLPFCSILNEICENYDWFRKHWVTNHKIATLIPKSPFASIWGKYILSSPIRLKLKKWKSKRPKSSSFL